MGIEISNEVYGAPGAGKCGDVSEGTPRPPLREQVRAGEAGKTQVHGPPPPRTCSAGVLVPAMAPPWYASHQVQMWLAYDFFRKV